MHQIEDLTGAGQALDILTAPEDKIDFTQFTLERYHLSCFLHAWMTLLINLPNGFKYMYIHKFLKYRCITTYKGLALERITQ